MKFEKERVEALAPLEAHVIELLTKWTETDGVRATARRVGLSTFTVYKCLSGQPVRRSTRLMILASI